MPDSGGDATSLDILREQPENADLLGGFGPLLVGIVLFLLIVFLAPTVAPEQVIEQPVGGAPSTSAVLGAP